MLNLNLDVHGIISPDVEKYLLIYSCVNKVFEEQWPSDMETIQSRKEIWITNVQRNMSDLL